MHSHVPTLDMFFYESRFQNGYIFLDTKQYNLMFLVNNKPLTSKNIL
jgi:hypothetical protein